MCTSIFSPPKAPDISVPTPPPVKQPDQEGPSMQFNPEALKRKKKQAGTKALQIPLGGVGEQPKSGLNV